MATIGVAMSFPPSDAAVEQRVVEFPDAEMPTITVTVRRSSRARHVRVHVSEQGEVTVSAPRRLAAHRIDAIVRDRGDWLREALQRMQLAARSTEVDLGRGDPVRLLGTWHPSRVVEARRAACHVDDADTIVVGTPTGSDPFDVLVRWYRSEARRVIEQRVDHYARAFGISHGAISIRDQRTRWGSCSHRGDLSFNWRLVLAPIWVLDSIVVHELCHIDELNHSDRFWRLLDRRYPRHREARAWLEQHGAALRVTRGGDGQGSLAPAMRAAGDEGGLDVLPAVEGTADGSMPVAPLRRVRRSREPDECHLRLF